MNIKATVHNSHASHEVSVQTNGVAQTISIPPKPTGFGSSVNGGELLFLALATCYCNDIYREAFRRQVEIVSAEVIVEGTFGAEGEPAGNIRYSAKVRARASEHEIEDLMRYTDQVAEIQNTLRTATPVTLARMEAIQA